MQAFNSGLDFLMKYNFFVKSEIDFWLDIELLVDPIVIIKNEIQLLKNFLKWNDKNSNSHSFSRWIWHIFPK